MENFQASFIKSGNEKGIATFYNPQIIKPEDQVNMERYQIGKFRNGNIDIINIYRSQAANSVKLLDDLRKIIEVQRITLVTGDFNTCFRENYNNKLIQGLLSLGFCQLMHEATHIQGRHIDHAYLLDPIGKVHTIVERYSPYYSDHDGICIVIQNLVQEDKDRRQ